MLQIFQHSSFSMVTKGNTNKLVNPLAINARKMEGELIFVFNKYASVMRGMLFDHLITSINSLSILGGEGADPDLDPPVH